MWSVDQATRFTTINIHWQQDSTMYSYTCTRCIFYDEITARVFVIYPQSTLHAVGRVNAMQYAQHIGKRYQDELQKVF